MIVGGVSLAAAPAASATDFPISVACGGVASTDVVNLTVAPGDTVTVTPVGCEYFGYGDVAGSVSWSDADGTHTKSAGSPGAAALTPGLTNVLFTAPATEWSGFAFSVGHRIGGSSDYAVIQYFVTVSVGGNIASSATPIPDWVQAYGRASKGATCLHGWIPSWQAWAEPVTGGWVCTRDIPSLG
jgi:hypothetical protein